MTKQFYLHAPDGRCLYVIRHASQLSTLNDGAEVLRHKWINGGYEHLVLTPGPATSLSATFSKREYSMVEFVLVDAALASVRCPMTIGPADYEALEGDLREWYTRPYTETETVVTWDLSDVTPLELGPIPTEPCPQNWNAGPYLDLFGPTVQHLVPGYLSGFAERQIEILKEYGDTYSRPNEGGPLEVSMKVWYDPPKTTKHKVGRKMVDKETWMTIKVQVVRRPRITGNTLAEATAAWNTAEIELRTLLDEHRRTKTCGYCLGRGTVLVKP